MPWIRFTASFNWHVKPTVTISYRADGEYNVTGRCAAEAIAKGKATRIPAKASKHYASR